jgi:hypothetical protein
MDEDNGPAESRIPNGPPLPRVGYKVPPEAHRFSKGQSGNPRGRPKGAMGKKQIAQKVLLEQHVVDEDGRKVKRTILEWILLAYRSQAFEGSSRAFKEMEKLAEKFDPQPPAKRAGVLVVPGRLTMESWREMYEPKRDPTQYDPDEE